jgi:hypothetical protein
MSNIPKILDLRENAKSAIGQTYTSTDRVYNFISVVLKLSFMFVMLTLNFLGLSVALNCNINSSVGRKFGVALYGFFFGPIYLMLNYYTYRVLTLKQVCRFDKERLFPFHL